MNNPSEEMKECPYCGQISLTGGECDCQGAQRARKIEDQIQRAEFAINEIFGESCKENGYLPVSEESIGILHTVAAQIANHKMHAVSFVLPNGIKAKLSRGSKGIIKVERSETKKNSTEVEE